MKKSRRLLSIILAASVLLSSNAAAIEPTGEMIRNFSDDISGEYETFPMIRKSDIPMICQLHKAPISIIIA